MIDVTLTLTSRGTALLHDPHCLEVHVARIRGEPLLTMFGCKKMPDYELHGCLKGVVRSQEHAHAADPPR